MNLKGKKGVDISAANGDVSIKKIKDAGYDFVMIRCGYGSDLRTQDDSQFENNVRKCEAEGMPWGTYLYSYALNSDEAESEAEHAARLLKGKKPTFPVALDMEDADGYKKRNGGLNFKTINTVCRVFLEKIADRGYYPMLYTGIYYLDAYISPEVFKKYDLWIAQWNSVCQYDGANLGMWQYGGEQNFLESNSIPGVGVIDKDKCYRDYPYIIKYGGYNGWNGSEPSELAPDVYYKVKTDGRWLPEVKNCEDYAGIRGSAVTDLAVRVSKGSVKYRVHVKGGRWLPYVSGCDTSDYEYGYAGIGKPVDAVEIIYSGSSYQALYRVSPVGGGYFDWQRGDEKTGGQDGYAGLYGKAIDRIQIKLAK